MTDYKHTLNLPQTDFPMKGNLANREPEMLKQWQQDDRYAQLRKHCAGRETFLLHDGPPYANGDLHIGHSVNKILKDIIIKSKTLSNFDAPYTPGWDCHGLPIELMVEKKHGRAGQKIDASEFRKKCREYAATQVDKQREDFIRMGVLGDWGNPYLTMNFETEANIVRALGKIIERGHLHKGAKPVHWCLDCGSALAEAEVEHADKVSPSIDVAFRATDSVALRSTFNVSGEGDIDVVIWTTTPWTLPANQAVCVHPTLEYSLVQTPERLVVLASELVNDAMQRYGIEDFSVLGTASGSSLEHTQLSHPFLEKKVPVILGDHVTTEAGTGCVHTAPGHGQDDYIVGKQYDLEVHNPVGSNGVFLPDTPLFAGQHVNKANPLILETLEEKSTLVSSTKLTHSYPHCWRHKTPIIFRATPQWFISMDQNKLREHALSEIKGVDWLPDWGQARIEGMVEGRPDWCISRQRTWGVPIPLFVHKETDQLHPNTDALIAQVADAIEEQGINAWFDLDASDLLGDEADQYDKVSDTLDVWFDSGTTHHSVVKQQLGMQQKADLYLEGSDQHRGWFQSSLLSSVAMTGEAPYKQVLTHGFTVDAKGQKMSKSLGNTMAPQKIMKQMGADILRLWVSSTDYTSEITVSDENFKRVADSYRRIRNTARFLLSNLAGFDPKTDLVPFDDLVKLDKWIIARAVTTQNIIEEAYGEYAFHEIYQQMQLFCGGELSSFYLDIVKDRQYTTASDCHARRSTQTAMYHVLEALVRWMAPILSFTAEEIWQHMPAREEDSVLFTNWYDFPDYNNDDPQAQQEYWLTFKQLKDDVSAVLEPMRKEKTIGSPLDVEVDVYTDADTHSMLDVLGEELRFVLITSGVHIHTESAPAGAQEFKHDDGPSFSIVASVSAHSKCDRCWHHRKNVGSISAHPTLCQRCVTNIDGDGEERHYA